MSHGLIAASSIPGWPAPNAGVMEGCEAALELAGFSGVVSNTPDGILVSDVATAQAFFAGYVGSASQLAFNKADKLAQLAAIYASKYAAGFNYTGPDNVKRTFQIDAQSQFNIDVQSNAALGSMLAGEAWVAGSYFIASDNSHMPLTTAQDMRAFSLAVRGYVSSLILWNRALKDQIAAATTMAQLQAIDITSGWSPNP